MPSPTLLLLGSGPNIGLHTALLFASHNHFSTIILLSRDATRLQNEKSLVEQQAGGGAKVLTYPCDLTNFEHLRKTLKEIESLGPVGCVFFNAARIRPSEILTTGWEEVEEDFRTTNLAMYIVAQWAIPLLQSGSVAAPTFVVTNSLLPEHPLPFLMSLSAVKASQQNMVHSMRAAFGEKIHIGLVKVGGQVSSDDEVFNPAAIAKEIVRFYEQGKEEWGGDIIIQ